MANEPRINDLPDAAFANVAKYLTKPSLALFAVASSQSQISNLLISYAPSWEELDFSDIDKVLAARLTDDDILYVLQKIDAVYHLKTLRLAGCINISGSSLEVLRASTVIEHIDISLVGKHENPTIKPEPSLSESAVIPILGTIINGGGSLKLLHLPIKFRESPSQSQELQQFLERYSQYLVDKNVRCTNCDNVCVEEWLSYDREDDDFGIQNNTCSVCVRHFCNRDTCENLLKFCSTCQKQYCETCDQGGIDCLACITGYACNECKQTCVGCDIDICGACTRVCSVCNGIRCEDCSYDDSVCHTCRKRVCSCTDCAGSLKEEFTYCMACSREFCSPKCQLKKHENGVERFGKMDCLPCLATAAKSFQQKLKISEKKNKKLKQENERLKKEAGEEN